MPVPHECGFTGAITAWGIPCKAIFKQVKILYHLITLKAGVYLAKSENNVPKCNAFLEFRREHSSPQWIQYLTFLIQPLQMLILGDVPVTLFGTVQTRHFGTSSPVLR